MPTLNYENIGALVDYEYLHGTIAALYLEDDTADVSGVCGALSRVPIFYHCTDTSIARSNGAIQYSAQAFSVGDGVVVLKGSASANNFESRYYVIGFYGEKKRCATPGVLWVRSYAGFWDYSIFGLFYPDIKRQFAWDLIKDDYATDVLIVEPGSGERLIEKGEWPIGIDNGVFGLSIEKRFGSLTLKPTFVAEGRNVVALNGVNLNNLKIGVGDYIWQTHNPGVWGNVTHVSGSMLKTDNSVVLADMVGSENHNGFTVSSSIPVYYLYEYELAEFIWIRTSEEYIVESPFVYYWLCTYECSEKTVTTVNAITGETSTSTRSCTGIYHTKGNLVDGVIQTYVLTHSVQVKYKTPFSDDVYTRTYTVSMDHTMHPAEIYIDSESGNPDFLGETAWSVTETRPGGVRTYTGDAFLSNSQNYGYEDETDPIWILCDGAIDRYHNAKCNREFSWEHHVYRGYERNIRAQCSPRGSTSAPTTTRSSALESAIERLIDTTRSLDKDKLGNTLNMVGVYMEYYSETRQILGPFDMLSMINGVRGYSELMTEDSGLMAECEAKAAYFVANAICSHDTPPVQDGVEECISVCRQTDDLGYVITGWMASPHHAEIIMDPRVDVLGWATRDYPSGLMSITYGAGMFNALTGEYSTTEETINFETPQSLRCWVLQLKARE
jgi:hypothetical protein